MNQAQGHQQELERQEWEREWHCCYCGKPMNPGCPHPSQFECCGEVGHVERLNDQGKWEYGYE
jgi:hypothetical protein